MTDKAYQWISIEEQTPPLDTVCFLSFGHWVGFGARIIINAEVDPRSVFCGVLGVPIFHDGSSKWYAEFDIDNIMHPTRWMPLPTPPSKTGE